MITLNRLKIVNYKYRGIMTFINTFIINMKYNKIINKTNENVLLSYRYSNGGNVFHNQYFFKHLKDLHRFPKFLKLLQTPDMSGVFPDQRQYL